MKSLSRRFEISFDPNFYGIEKDFNLSGTELKPLIARALNMGANPNAHFVTEYDLTRLDAYGVPEQRGKVRLVEFAGVEPSTIPQDLDDYFY